MQQSADQRYKKCERTNLDINNDIVVSKDSIHVVKKPGFVRQGNSSEVVFMNQDIA